MVYPEEVTFKWIERDGPAVKITAIPPEGLSSVP